MKHIPFRSYGGIMKLGKEKTRLSDLLVLSALVTLFTAQQVFAGEKLFEHGVQKVGEFRINKGNIIGPRDLSGIARVGDFHCLIASDEGVYVQTGRFVPERREIIIDDPAESRIELLSPKLGSEIDIEAIAAIGNTYYVMASHGVAKKSGLFMEARHTCFRLEVDPKTGQQTGSVHRASLQRLLRGDEVLGVYYGKLLQQRGVNIEGLAAKDGKLFVGFRSPNLKGKAYVVEIRPEVLFAGPGKPSYKLHDVALGPGLGIREIVTLQSGNEYNGFLIIAGNAGCEPGNTDEPDTVTNVKDWQKGRGFFLFFWDGGERVEMIGEIPRAGKGYKAEAMTVLSDTKEAIDMLILFDGPAGGAPTVYRIYKKKGR
jgi:hypothetical protein